MLRGVRGEPAMFDVCCVKWDLSVFGAASSHYLPADNKSTATANKLTVHLSVYPPIPFLLFMLFEEDLMLEGAPYECRKICLLSI
jgi:hypothetical protein